MHALVSFFTPLPHVALQQSSTHSVKPPSIAGFQFEMKQKEDETVRGEGIQTREGEGRGGEGDSSSQSMSNQRAKPCPKVPFRNILRRLNVELNERRFHK